MKRSAKLLRIGGTWRQWILLALLTGVYLGGFIPLFPYMGGSIGIFQNLLVLLGGWILGFSGGAAYGIGLSVASIPLWRANTGFSMAASVTAIVLAFPVAASAAWIHGVWRNTRQQYEELQVAHRELSAARQKLAQSEKLAFLGEMAAGVAHEINQPLSIISMSAEAALMDIEQGQTANVAADLRKIVSEVHRAGQVIFRMKSMGRRAPDEERFPTAINEIVAAALTQFREPFQVEGIVLRTEYCADAPVVTCHASQIEQVFTNILMNAMDALRGAPRREIAVRTLYLDSMGAVEIADTGPGISSEAMPSIFEPFFSTKEVGKGSGLGLSIGYRIVQEHGGDIEVESKPGGGTRFRILLPIG
jgi:C4-dicarboxylate-specific signal transduction histidine kinase